MPKIKNKKLSEYKRKRDLSRSGEPSKGKKSSKGLIFVIQKHAARRLHYDLRLEAGGVLKSWAVPKGPSTDPKQKILAVMVEDHPLNYADFEGVIPEGNYGAGSVIVWDRGTYIMPGLSKEETEKRFLYGIEKGDMTFVLDGQKLKGKFTLARMKKGEKNWLLMKSHDEYAYKKIGDESSVKTKRIISSRDAINLSEIKSAPKGAIPKEIKPMMAKLVNKPFKKEGWIFEVKLDGYRAISFVGKKKLEIRSRNNISLNDHFPNLEKSLKKIKVPAVFDGEIVVLDSEGKANFQLLRKYLETGQGFPIYYIFDILYYSGRDLTALPLELRKAILKKILPILPDIRFTDHVETEGILLFNSTKQTGVEGIVAKNLLSSYEEGKRSLSWLKIKNILSQEAVIAGYTAPQGERKNFGALILGVYEKNKLVYIGHCGSGFNEKSLASIKKHMDNLAVPDPPFTIEPKTNAKPTWIKPEIVCEIRFTGWTKEGLMRHPIFMGIREDKNPRDVIREIPDKSEKFTSTKINTSLKITNPNKIFWKKEKITKKDMVEYYEKISDIMLPYLFDRPQSLHRFPSGIAEKGFYQKNITNVPPEIKTVPIYSDSEEKTINYLLCQDKTTLIYMANLGCIDINPWNSRIGRLDKPDYLILDIDPQGVNFKEVVRVALTSHQILKQADIPSYCKTSGATGLHICLPLQAKYDYEQVREFAHLINILVNRELPQITSLARMPNARKNKVYLDYLQNRRGQTLTAPYSLKPRPGAPVSTPLKWSEVNMRLKPENHNMKNIFKRIKKVGDLWEGVLGEGIDMLDAIEKLNKKF